MWEDEDCPLSSIYVEDMKSIGSVLDKGADISVPWLLIHGTEDDVVPIGESHEIFEKAAGNADKVVLDGAEMSSARKKPLPNWSRKPSPGFPCEYTGMPMLGSGIRPHLNRREPQQSIPYLEPCLL